MSNIDDFINELLQKQEERIAGSIYNELLVPYFLQKRSAGNGNSVNGCAGTEFQTNRSNKTLR